MVMGALGGAMMRGGAKLAGSSAAKSQAGSILASKDLDSLKKMVEGFRISNDHLKSIKKNTEKSAGLMALYSPALKQQLVVLKKSFELLMRPIGDIMARVLAPMARVLIKFALKAYKIMSLGGDLFGGSKLGGGVDEDRLEQLLFQRKEALMRGDKKGIAEIDKILKEILDKGRDAWKAEYDYRTKELGESHEQATDFIDKEIATRNSYWLDLVDLEDKFQIKLKDIHKNGMSGIATIVKTKYDTLLTSLNCSKRQSTRDDEWKYGDPLPDKNKSLPQSMALLKKTGWYKDLLPDKNKSLPQSMDLPKKTGWYKDLASGGSINETGTYNLHAGERVINAGDNSRAKSGDTFNSTFNIKAEIKNDMDINLLARRLAELQQTEIRRRVSY